MTYSKHRFEFFSDGVMAIIMTLMAVEIPVPEDITLTSVINLFQSVLIFFVSFCIVGWFCNRHHRLFDRVQTIDGVTMRWNLFFLFFVALIPVCTRWMLLHPEGLIPAVAYCIVYLLANLWFHLLSHQVYHQARKELLPVGGEPVKAHTVFRPMVFVRHILHCLILIGLFSLMVFFPDYVLVVYVLFPVVFIILMYLEKRLDGLL
jgi:uncharacterized membrane protein